MAAVATKRRRKRNPEGAAESMYSSFHGVPSTVVDEYREKEHYHSNLAALGELVGLKVRTVSGYDVTLGFESGKESNPKFQHGDKTYKGFRFHPYLASDEKYHWYIKSAPRPSDNVSGVFGPFNTMEEAVADAHRWIEARKEGKRWLNPGKKSNAFWPFDSFTHTTIYHVPSGHKFTTTTKHGGHTIYKSTTKNGYVVPTLDRDSVFDTPKDAKKFIDHWGKHQNPKKGKRHGKSIGPVAASQQFVGDTIGAISKPMNEFIGTVGSVVDKGFKKVGIKGNPSKTFKSRFAASAFADLQKLRGKYSNVYRVEGDDEKGIWRVWYVPKQNSTIRRSNPDHVLLCSTEDGKNLQLVGGNQSLDLDALKIDGELAEKELITVGEVWGLNYFTEKVFGDGGSEDGETQYIHILGMKETKPPRGGDLWEDAVPPKDDSFGTGELPTLIYDKRNRKLLLSGGIYFVNQPLVGTSPGLEH